MEVTVVVGLGFGDEGKGTVVEALCNHYGAARVVRFNGGPQAAHHVVRADATVHCFAQFGSASFQGVPTHFSRGALCKPSNLLYEADKLRSHGVDVLSLWTGDPGVRIVTPFHGVLGRAREKSRGDGRHGSVGMGVGEAIRESTFRVSLTLGEIATSSDLSSAIRAHRDYVEEELRKLPGDRSEDMKELFSIPVEKVVETYRELLRRAPRCVVPDEMVMDTASEDDHLIFESAQGALLDPLHGFTPHVTKTRVTISEAEKVYGAKPSRLMRLGVFRLYMTRHGAGPMVTEDSSLDAKLPELHNRANEWQGRFRLGHLDAVALRYAVRCAGPFDGLAVTHLDKGEALAEVKVCTAYRYLGKNREELKTFFRFGEDGLVKEILPGPRTETERAMLTQALKECVPGREIIFRGGAHWSKELPRFLAWVESSEGFGLPVKVKSFGPMLADKKVE